jgi:hypothetical protein
MQPDDRTLALSFLGCLAAAAAVAAWCSLGRLHAFHDSDSLLLVLVSTQRWTPFYWHEDRFGMLVPLLARPIHDPYLNLLFQGWITTTAGLVAPFLVAAFFGVRRGAAAVAALATAMLLFVMTPATRLDWFVRQPYGLSLSLGFGGLLLGERKPPLAFAWACVLLWLAHWVNLGAALVLLPAVLLRGRPSLRALAPLAAAFAGAVVAQHAWRPTTVDFGPTDMAIAPLQWIGGWKPFVHNFALRTAHPLAAAALAVLCVGAVWGMPRDSDNARKASAAMVLTTAIALLVTGSIRHVAANDYNIRYFYPSMVLCATVVSLFVCESLRLRPLLRGIGAALVLAAAVVQAFGLPAPARVARTLDNQFGSMTGAILATDASVVAGGYWSVWPAVFHANMTLYRQRSQRQVYGLTYRSHPTEEIWAAESNRPVRLIGMLREDDEVGAALQRSPVPFHFAERFGPYSLFETEATGSERYVSVPAIRPTDPPLAWSGSLEDLTRRVR